jgi:uncharacterized protein YqgV (UPF0045/DUF77 family)
MKKRMNMDHKINLALQIIPKSNKEDIYTLVDKAIQVIQDSGLKYEVCPFETVMEGGYEEILQVVKKAQVACFAAGAEELLVNIKMQVRKDGDVSIEEKTGKYK